MQFDRQASGSHEIWFNPATHRYTTIPNHPGDLPEGTLRDIERNGKTEADHIIGDMLRRAHEHKLQTPLLRLAYCNLQAYEARQSKT